MTKHLSFSVYDAQNQARIRVFAWEEFRTSASYLFRTHHELRPRFSDFNELVKRFATEQALSSDSFRQEGPGYAFRCGRLRCYGVYSRIHKGCFVLSHAIYKSQRKLDQGDRQLMETCLSTFDSLTALPSLLQVRR